MRVIGYVRVSTEEQASDGVSLAAQREKVEGYAKLYDLELVGIIEDRGQSGKTLNRPGLQEALDRLRKGEVDGLLIPKLDRLSRESDPAEQEAVQLMRQLKAAGESLRDIAAELTRRGILTKEGNTAWKHTAVARILLRAA